MQKLIKKISMLILLVFIASIPLSAFAADELKAYSLEEITKIALERNPAIKSAEAKMEGVEITRDRANLTLSFIPAAGFYMSPEPLMLYKQVRALDRGYDSAKDNIQLEADKLTYAILQKYQELINIQTDLELVEKELEEARDAMSRAILMRNHGLLSEIEAQGAIELYKISKNKLQKTKDAEAKAYTLLNSAAGIYSEERYELRAEIIADISQEMKESDLPRLIDSARNGLISRMMQRNVDQTQLSYDFYSYNDPKELRSYDAIGKDLDSEKADLAATKNNLADAIRNLFYTAKDMQKTYQDLQAKNRLDQRAYDIKRIQFDYGMITQSDLREAEITLDENKANLLALQNGFNEVIFMLNYPHVATR